MNKDFIFRTGKHIGETYEHVEQNDPGYITWAEENRPELLKESRAKKISKPKTESELPMSKLSALTPNLNFFNEKQ